MIKKKPHKILATVFMVIAGSWLSMILWGNIQQLKNTSYYYRYWQFFAALPFAVTTLYFSAITYYFILLEITGKPTSFTKVVIAYLNSQIVRYLPGKIWGIIYQAKQMEAEVSSLAVWKANLVQYLLGMSLSLIAITCLYVRHKIEGDVYLITFVFMIFVYYVALRYKWFYNLIDVVAKRFLTKFSLDTEPSSSQKFLHILASIFGEWAFFFLTWFVLLYPQYSFVDTLVLSILYVASWIVGFIAFIPGGMLVRESAFVSLGMYFGFVPGALAFYAILGRILFSLSDIVGMIVSYVFYKKYRKKP